MADTKGYVERLIAQLKPLYTPQALGCGGHDWTHCERMVLMADEMAGFFEFDRDEYTAAVWLHTVDHAPEFRERISKGGLKRFLVDFLLEDSSPFSYLAIANIAEAVDEHWVEHDRPTDSALRGVLRLADKWDRYGVVGTSCSAAFRGARLLPYNPENPFAYPTRDEFYESSLLDDYYKILEWYPQFPLIRELVKRHPNRMRILLAGARAWGKELSELYKIPNRIEENLQRALGGYYSEWKP